MNERLVIWVFGGSGHGKVVAEAAMASHRFTLRGFLDDDPARHGRLLMGLPIEGGTDGIRGQQGRVGVALGIGSNEARLALFERLVALGHSIVSVIHPSSVVASGAVVGEGTYVGPLAVIHADARVGRACIVNSGAVVEHDDVLGDGVHVSPNATLGGSVTLGHCVQVGLGASVIPGITIGPRSVVGAGAVVLADVPSDTTVVGVPARPIPSRRQS